MEFRTKINLLESGLPKIDYSSKIFGIGSCFAQNLGEKLEYFQFSQLTNPFGIIFNPASLATLLERITSRKQFEEKDCFLLNDVWQSFELHSCMNALTQDDFLQTANKTLSKAQEFLSSCTHVVLTFGTSWVYELKENQVIVANCHKVPQFNFEKRLLSLQEIQESLNRIDKAIKQINPETTILYTISPVRHLKDGFEENFISKSQLRIASHEFSKSNKKWKYFPSYEIMMDELRDYRFYATDMLHPNDLAIDYIWDKFIKVWVETETMALMKQVDSIQKRKNHKPFNSSSEKHQAFLIKLRNDIEELRTHIPNLQIKV